MAHKHFEPFVPDAAHPFDAAKTAHLLRRAGFGAPPADVAAAVARGLEETIDDLFTEADDEEQEFQRTFNAINGKLINAGDAGVCQAWWVYRMLTTRVPLREKLALFWHGHFATSVNKVEDTELMLQQIATFRRLGFGSFRELALAVARDPAMIVWLDGESNVKEHPNENFARELMELFTCGIGNYTEQDIREAARAFTGYRIDMTTQQFRFAPFQQDLGRKTFMGRTGAFNGDDIIDILMKQPACAQFIGRKLWRYFVEDDPPQQIVDAVSSRIREHNYDMRPVLREIFSSEEFYSDRAMRTQIKSPIHYIVQTSKLLEAKLPSPIVTQNAMRQMGQILFAPPNVKGWDGGKAWISTSTLLFRYNFANYLINGDAMLPMRGAGKQRTNLGFRPPTELTAQIKRAPIDTNRIVPTELRQKPRELVNLLSRRFFQGLASEKETDVFVKYLEARRPDSGDETMRALVHLMMSTPQFQLA